MSLQAGPRRPARAHTATCASTLATREAVLHDSAVTAPPVWRRQLVVAATTLHRLTVRGPDRPVWRVAGYGQEPPAAGKAADVPLNQPANRWRTPRVFRGLAAGAPPFPGAPVDADGPAGLQAADALVHEPEALRLLTEQGLKRAFCPGRVVWFEVQVPR